MSDIHRGEIWWADLAEPRRSEPGYRRPVLVIQADPFNRSRIQTAVVAVITGNLELAEAPGNVIIDDCSRCELNWLDHGELMRIATAPDRAYDENYGAKRDQEP